MNELIKKINNPMEAAVQMGGLMAKSGLCGVKTAEQGFVLAMTSLWTGQDPMKLSMENHIINGKLSMRADAMHSKFLQLGGSVDWVESSEDVCSAVFKHPKYCPNGLKETITFKEMKEAGVTSNPIWRKFPKQMLRARVISSGVRAVCPMVNSGQYTPEEVVEFDSDAFVQDKPLPPDPEPLETVSAAFVKAKSLPSGTETLEKAEKVIKAMTSLGLTRDQVILITGGKAIDEWTDEDIDVLRNEYKALKEMSEESRKEFLTISERTE